MISIEVSCNHEPSNRLILMAEGLPYWRETSSHWAVDMVHQVDILRYTLRFPSSRHFENSYVRSY